MVVAVFRGCDFAIATVDPAPMRAGIVAALDSSAAGWTTLNLDKFMDVYLDSSITSYATKTGYLHGRGNPRPLRAGLRPRQEARRADPR
jgi:hypothetical protein